MVVKLEVHSGCYHAGLRVVLSNMVVKQCHNTRHEKISLRVVLSHMVVKLMQFSYTGYFCLRVVLSHMVVKLCENP